MLCCLLGARKGFGLSVGASLDRAEMCACHPTWKPEKTMSSTSRWSTPESPVDQFFRFRRSNSKSLGSKRRTRPEKLPEGTLTYRRLKWTSRSDQPEYPSLFDNLNAVTAQKSAWGQGASGAAEDEFNRCCIVLALRAQVHRVISSCSSGPTPDGRQECICRSRRYGQTPD